MRMQVRCSSRKIENGQQEEEVVMIGRFSEQVRFQVVDLSWPLVPFENTRNAGKRGFPGSTRGGFQYPDTKLSRKSASLSMFDR